MKIYDDDNKLINEINEGRGLIKKYNEENNLIYQCEYPFVKKMEKKKHFIKMVI